MDNIKEKNVRYNMIDVMKLIMSFLVVMIHKPLISLSHPFPKFILEEVICAAAVPFFFITSSFLFFKRIEKENNGRKSFISYEKRLLILYIAWTVVYIPSNLIKYYGIYFEGMTIKLFISALIQILINFFLSASFVHLWYVNTLMISIAVVYFIRKKLSSNATLIISLMIFFISKMLPMLYSCFPFVETIWEAVPEVVLNVCQKGLPCVAIGMFLSNFRGYRPRNEIVFVLFAFIIMIGFSVITYKEKTALTETVLFFLIYIFSTSVFLLCRDIKLKDSPKYKTIRSYSSIIYFSHLLMMSEIFALIAEKTGITAFAENRFLVYFTTVFVALLLSTAVVSLSKMRGFKWLKYIY